MSRVHEMNHGYKAERGFLGPDPGVVAAQRAGDEPEADDEEESIHEALSDAAVNLATAKRMHRDAVDGLENLASQITDPYVRGVCDGVKARVVALGGSLVYLERCIAAIREFALALEAECGR